jgi:hypothetical protein
MTKGATGDYLVPTFMQVRNPDNTCYHHHCSLIKVILTLSVHDFISFRNRGQTINHAWILFQEHGTHRPVLLLSENVQRRF